MRYDRAGSLGDQLGHSSRSASLSAEPLELLHIPPAKGGGVAYLVCARRRSYWKRTLLFRPGRRHIFGCGDHQSSLTLHAEIPPPNHQTSQTAITIEYPGSNASLLSDLARRTQHLALSAVRPFLLARADLARPCAESLLSPTPCP